jgi:hypothetical protein
MKIYRYKTDGRETDEICFLKSIAGLGARMNEDIEDKLQFNNITCKISEYRKE